MSCPPGSYQILTNERLVNDDGTVIQYVEPKCMECPIGYYQDEQGQPRCKKCPPGYSTSTTGVHQQSDFVKQCPPLMHELNHVLSVPEEHILLIMGQHFALTAMRSPKNHYVHNVRNVITSAMKIIPRVLVTMVMFFLKMGTAASNVHHCKRMLMEK